MLNVKIQYIHPLHCALLLHIAKVSGLSPEQICKASQLERMKSRQHPRWFAAMLLKLQKESEHPAICTGFEYGQQLDLACAGVVGQAVMTAQTLGEALNLMCRYYILMGPKFYFDPQKNGKQASMVIDLAYRNAPEQVRIFVFEALITSWKKCCQMLVGMPLVPTMLHFDYKPPPHAHLYSKLFQCDVIFNSPQTVISAKPEILSLPTLTANPVVHERSVAYCEAALLKLGLDQSLTDKVRRLLKTAPDWTHVSLDTLAQSVNLSSRTLNRRLQSEGYSFQALLDEQRCDFACRLLARSELKIDRVAEQLGYSDPSNFRRAFKKWTGETPSDYRKGH
jgi:AraC-like DNA-binding protein